MIEFSELIENYENKKKIFFFCINIIPNVIL